MEAEKGRVGNIGWSFLDLPHLCEVPGASGDVGGGVRIRVRCGSPQGPGVF